MEVSYNTGGVGGVNRTITKIKTISLKSKLSHSSVSISINSDDTRLSLCDIYTLQATKVTDDQGGFVDYSWCYKTNNHVSYQLFDQTSNMDVDAHLNSIDLTQFNSDLSVKNISFKVKVASNNCPSAFNFEYATVEKEVTFCYDLDSVVTKNPTCFGKKDPKINIHGLPDPTALALYEINTDTFDITFRALLLFYFEMTSQCLFCQHISNGISAIDDMFDTQS